MENNQDTIYTRPDFASMKVGDKLVFVCDVFTPGSDRAEMKDHFWNSTQCFFPCTNDFLDGMDIIIGECVSITPRYDGSSPQDLVFRDESGKIINGYRNSDDGLPRLVVGVAGSPNDFIELNGYIGGYAFLLTMIEKGGSPNPRLEKIGAVSAIRGHLKDVKRYCENAGIKIHYTGYTPERMKEERRQFYANPWCVEWTYSTDDAKSGTIPVEEGRYKVGEKYVFMRDIYNTSGDRFSPLYAPWCDTLDGVQFVVATCKSRHRVPGDYGQGMSEGFIFEEADGEIWYNQYPSASYGQTDDSCDRQIRHSSMYVYPVPGIDPDGKKHGWTPFTLLQSRMENIERGIKDLKKNGDITEYEALVRWKDEMILLASQIGVTVTPTIKSLGTKGFTYPSADVVASPDARSGFVSAEVLKKAA